MAEQDAVSLPGLELCDICGALVPTADDPRRQRHIDWHQTVDAREVS